MARSIAQTDGAPGLSSSAKSAGRSGLIQAASTGRPRMKKSSSESSLDAMEDEIQDQIKQIPRFAKELGHLGAYRNLDFSKIIFTGSGDSFASALFAQAISKGRAIAADPYEIYLAPDRVRGKTLFLISVSGRTKTNVKLARRVKGLAENRVAITANPASPLAKECDDTLQLHYTSRGVLTSGTVSFTTSLLAVASLTTELPSHIDLRNVEERASQWANRVTKARGKAFLFIGSGIGYAIAAYGAFKIHEVLGFKAEYQYPEQVGHSQLFSIRKKADSIISVALGPDINTRRIFRALSEAGFRPQIVRSVSSHPVLAALDAALNVQHLALGLARRLGLRECAFLLDKARLGLSNRLIY